jgi:hypothetical protein
MGDYTTPENLVRLGDVFKDMENGDSTDPNSVGNIKCFLEWLKHRNAIKAGEDVNVDSDDIAINNSINLLKCTKSLTTNTTIPSSSLTINDKDDDTNHRALIYHYSSLNLHLTKDDDVDEKVFLSRQSSRLLGPSTTGLISHINTVIFDYLSTPVTNVTVNEAIEALEESLVDSKDDCRVHSALSSIYVSGYNSLSKEEYLKAASEHASLGLDMLDSSDDALSHDEKLLKARLLTSLGQCYIAAEQAVTAEGLLSNANDVVEKCRESGKVREGDALTFVSVWSVRRGLYGMWDKREVDAEREDCKIRDVVGGGIGKEVGKEIGVECGIEMIEVDYDII